MARYAWRSSGGPAERGVSTVVGVTLLIGMVITGALLVFLLGSSLLTDIETQGQMEVAEQSFRESASQIQELQSGNSDQAVLALPADSGDVNVVRETTIRVTANRNASCTTGPVPIGTVVYQNDAGDQIGYEFGGVWRQYDGGGSTMVSAPSVEYRDGRLSLSLSDFEGIPTGEEVRATLNQTGSQNLSADLTEAMLSNQTVQKLRDPSSGPVRLTCGNTGLDNVTLHVNGSRFASAWQQFGQRNFDERKVGVVPAGSVTAGENVTMTFDVGTNVETEFRVRDVDANASVLDSDVTKVEATIENTGEIPGGEDVTLKWYDPGNGFVSETGPESVTNPLTLDGGERTNVTFRVPSSAYTGTLPETYTFNVTTPDDERTGDVTVGTGAAAPDFNVSVTGVPARAELSDNVTFRATVENDPDAGATFTATKEVVFRYDGNVIDRRRVTLADGASETLEFYIRPPQKKPNVPINVSTVDDHDVEQITIGDSAYFTIDSSSAPSSVTVGDNATVSAELNNTGTLQGTQQVTVEIRNVTTGNLVAATLQSVTLSGGTQTTVSTSVGPLPQAGRYNYTVETQNDESVGNIYAGSSANANFVVTSSTTTDRVQPGGTVVMNATVTNTGSSNGTEEVRFYFNGTLFAHPEVTVPAGESESVERYYAVPNSKPLGEYDSQVEATGSKLESTVEVFDPDARNFENRDETIVAEQDIEVRVTVLGTSLTAYNQYRDQADEVLRAPIEMALYTENESSGAQYNYLWGQDTDLNRPQYREQQIDNDPFLSRELTVSNGTELSVFAESFSCARYYWGYTGWEDSGYDRVIEGRFANSFYCSDRGGTIIDINQNENPSNLVILEDGDQVPAYQQATADQRGVDDILEEKVDDTGRLNLTNNQLVLLYELSESSADPDDAAGPGDPDYNDAVVLFEQIRTVTENRVSGRADFDIVDTQAPAQTTGGSPSFDVTIQNNGSVTDSTEIAFEMNGGQVATTQTGNLDPQEQTTVSFTIPTSSASIPNSPSLPDTVPMTAQVTENGDDRAERNIYIGSRSEPYFLVNVEDAPTAVKPGQSFDVTVDLQNVGGRTDSQNVVRAVASSPPPTVSPSTDSRSVGLGPGGSQTETFSATASGTGTLQLSVASENVTETVQIAVDERDFVVDRTLVGAQSFDAGSTISATNLSSLDVVVENDAAVPGTGTVEMAIESQHDGSVDTTLHPESAANRPLSLQSGQSKVLTFDIPSGVDVGTYEYTVDTGDDTFTGTIQITTTPTTGGNNAPEDDLVTVDGNVIVLGG